MPLLSVTHFNLTGIYFHNVPVGCFNTLFLYTVWKGLQLNSCSSSFSITELAVAWLACLTAMRLLSIQYTGVQLGNSSSPERHWKAFLLKINPVRPRPASQPCRPCAACRLASPFPLIHCNFPFMRKPSYGCAQAGAGAFKPSATHICSLRHTHKHINKQRQHV